MTRWVAHIGIALGAAFAAGGCAAESVYIVQPGVSWARAKGEGRPIYAGDDAWARAKAGIKGDVGVSGGGGSRAEMIDAQDVAFAGVQRVREGVRDAAIRDGLESRPATEGEQRAGWTEVYEHPGGGDRVRVREDRWGARVEVAVREEGGRGALREAVRGAMGLGAGAANAGVK